MLAVGVMSNELKFFVYLAAVALLLLAAFRNGNEKVKLMPLGLALFVLPTLWDTFALAFD
jgi:hypothetical protein